MIGERLYDLRKEKGLTQEALAKHLALTKYTISSYEKDKSAPNDEIKVNIAKFFDVSLDYLLGLIDQPVSYKRDKYVVELPTYLPMTMKENLEEYVVFLDNQYRKNNKDQLY